jgi:hypothetical protein
VFLDAVNPVPSPELDAAEWIRAVRGAGRIVGAELQVSDDYWRLPAFVRRAVASVGGVRRILDATKDEEPFLLRDFGKHLAAAKDHEHRAQLAGQPVAGALEPSVSTLIAGVADTRRLPAPKGGRHATP